MISDKKRIADLTKLLATTRALAAEKDLDQLLDLIISTITKVLEADRTTLFLYDEETNELYDKIAQRWTGSELRFPVGKGLAGHVAKTLETLNITDAMSDPRFNPEFDRKSGYRTRTVLCFPLLTHEGRLIGVVQVLNKKTGPFAEYDERLLEGFSTHAAIAIDSARLVRHYVEKQQLEHALSVARSIQQNLLPKEAPEAEGMDFAGWSRSCDDTGGDYYDYVPLGDGELALVIADVSGHGVGPALIMAETRAYLRALLATLRDPAEVLRQINRMLARDMTEGRFVTMALAVLNIRKRSLAYSSAGHSGTVIYRASTGRFQTLETGGFPLGIFEESDFDSAPTVYLKSGDIFVLQTDGIAEARNAGNRLFGMRRALRVIREHSSGNAQALIGAIDRAVTAFRGGGPQVDDITCSVAKCL